MKNKLLFLLLITGPLAAKGQSDSSAFYLQKGVGEEQGGQWQAAFSCFQKAVAFNSANADAQVALGRAATRLKKFDIAAAAMEKGLSLKKQQLGTGAGFAAFNVDVQDIGEILAYAAGAGMLKSDGQNRYILGNTHTTTTIEYPDSAKGRVADSAEGRRSTSGAVDSAAIVRTPASLVSAGTGESLRDAEIAYRIGKVFLKKQNYRAAAPFLEQAVLLDSTQAGRTYECALNFAAIPDPLSAIKYYLLAEKRGYKADATYYKNLSNAYKATGQTAAAEATEKKQSSSL